MIKVLTYNIHKGFNRYNRDFVLHKIKQNIIEAEVDIVMLQEIQGHHVRHKIGILSSPDVSQFEFLADSIWPHYAYGKNAVYQKGHHGNAILSKFNIEEWSNINLSRFRRASRSFLHGVVKIPDIHESLNLICVHLDLIGFERRRQLNLLKDYIDQTIADNEPIIVAGDFNDWHGQSGKALEAQLHMREAIRYLHGNYAKTYPSHWPLLRMDRIYFRGMKLVQSGCLTRQPWNELSDHLPLFAQFGP